MDTNIWILYNFHVTRILFCNHNSVLLFIFKTLLKTCEVFLAHRLQRNRWWTRLTCRLWFSVSCFIWGGTQKVEVIYKKLCIYSYTFKLQPPSKYPPLDAIYLSRCFVHCSKQCLTLSILVSFSTSAVFCFTSSMLVKRFPGDFFHPEKKQKKCHLQWDWVNRNCGAWSSCWFGLKTAEHSEQCGKCTCKLPIMKWTNTLIERVFRKNSLKPNAASHYNSSWCTDPGGCLEHSPSWEVCTTSGPPSNR